MKIIGTGSSHPSLTVTNNDLAKFLDTSDEWIKTRTGISSRQIISNEDLREMSTESAKKAIKNAGIQAKEIDYILCSSVVSEYITPGISSLVHSDIGANCPCLNLNAACTGLIYAMQIAESFFQSGVAKTILIICAEEPSRMVDWSDRAICSLFGDGAGAIIAKKNEKNSYIYTRNQSICDVLNYRHIFEYSPFITKEEKDTPLFMKGPEVFKHAVSTSTKDIDMAIKNTGIKYEDVKYFILHQANIRIIETIAKLLKQSIDKFPHNIEKYGNTSSASIPLLLDELNCNNKLQKGDIIVLSAFGAGFTSGVSVIEW
ncbi:MAG TPA: beta-ketoacyl-ACP synthase 3 [Bacteroidaceae bacterium]|nr:beta-ketoacyl-ACP synthase 3 [Bacteroidaceae bacterium]